MKAQAKSRLHSVETASAFLAVPEATIRSWLSQRKLPRVKIGRLTRIREDDLLSLIRPPVGERTKNAQ